MDAPSPTAPANVARPASVTDGSLDRTLVETLTPLAGSLSLLFLLFIPFDYLHKPPHAVVPSIASDATTSALFFGLWLAARRQLVPSRFTNAILSASALLATANALLALAVIPNPIYSVYLMLIIVGLSAMLLSPSWLLLTVSLMLAAWVPVAWSHAPRPDFVNYAVTLVASVFLALAIQSGRRRASHKLARETNDRHLAERALKESEEHHRSLIENAWDIVAIIDPQGMIEYVSPAVRANLSYDPAELTGRSLLPLVHEDDQVTVMQELTRGTAPGEHAARVLETRVRDRQGAWHTIEVCYKPLADPKPQVGPAAPPSAPRLIANIRDITQRKELEARMARADRMASVGMLAAGVAHEINNPLTYVRTNLDYIAHFAPEVFDAAAFLRNQAFTAIKSGNADPTALAEVTKKGDRIAELAGSIVESMRDALEGTERVGHIIRDMRTFARVREESGAPVSVNDILETALKMTQNEIKSRAQVVRDYGSVSAVLANDNRLCQVFVNLLLNAAQAIDEGDAGHNTIRVRTWSQGATVVSEVADTGRGIPPENLGRLFDPFFSTKPLGIGSGLGLSISYNIVRSYGGTLEVTSQSGRGTQVLVRLPAAGESLLKDEREPAMARVDLGSQRVARARVLVVDDEPRIRASISRALRNEHEIVLAESGAEAISILERDSAFDVILSDLVMPNVSGAELFEWIETHKPDLCPRTVFMTGALYTRRSSALFERIPNLRLDKPLRFDELLATIDRVRGNVHGSAAVQGSV